MTVLTIASAVSWFTTRWQRSGHRCRSRPAMRWRRLSEQQRRASLQAAAEAAQLRLQRRRGALSPALIRLESARLVRVIEQWLEHEIETRSAFRVVAIEEARTMQVGPLTVAARLDRVDEYPDGARHRDRLQDRRHEERRLVRRATRRAAVAALPDGVRAGGAGNRVGTSARRRRWFQWSCSREHAAARASPISGRIDYATWSALVDHWSTVLERLATAIRRRRCCGESEAIAADLSLLRSADTVPNQRARRRCDHCASSKTRTARHGCAMKNDALKGGVRQWRPQAYRCAAATAVAGRRTGARRTARCTGRAGVARR